MTPQAMAALHARVFTMPPPWSANAFADLIASPGVFAIGDARGFLLGRTIAGEAEVLTLAVDPLHRRQGLGRGLVQRFLAQAKAQGADRAFLEVAGTNLSAIALYRTTGFSQAGIRRGYFRSDTGASVDAVVMAQDLRAAC